MKILLPLVQKAFFRVVIHGTPPENVNGKRAREKNGVSFLVDRQAVPHAEQNSPG